jgi:hypothetical protein
LRDDEGFATEARKLFEEGEERGEFPALSGLLAGASDEMATKLTVLYYSDAREALIKALGEF